MSTPRELSRIANRIAGKMTDDGWVSPGRKNLVSDCLLYTSDAADD